MSLEKGTHIRKWWKSPSPGPVSFMDTVHMEKKTDFSHCHQAPPERGTTVFLGKKGLSSSIIGFSPGNYLILAVLPVANDLQRCWIKNAFCHQSVVPVPCSLSTCYLSLWWMPSPSTNDKSNREFLLLQVSIFPATSNPTAPTARRPKRKKVIVKSGLVSFISLCDWFQFILRTCWNHFHVYNAWNVIRQVESQAGFRTVLADISWT